MLEQFAPGWVVLQHQLLLPIQSRDDHVMKIVVPGVQCNDERTPVLQMLLEVGPLASYCKRLESMLLQIPFQLGCTNPTRLAGVECTPDLVRRGNRLLTSLLAIPVLHHHRNTGGAASVLLLLYEWDIQPHGPLLRGKSHTAEKEVRNHRYDPTKHRIV